MSRFGVRVYKQYFNFASSHFLIFSDGGREELHGHNYQVRVQVNGAVGPDDMVLDFCKLKPLVKRFCDTLDHRLLLPGEHDALKITPDDDHLQVAFRRNDGGTDRFLFPARDVVILPIRNTSTERLAEYLAGQLVEALRAEASDAHLQSLSIEVEEAGGQCGLYEVDL